MCQHPKYGRKWPHFSFGNVAFRLDSGSLLLGRRMFENLSLNASQMLILLFWLMLAVVIIWGALWMRSTKR